MVDEVVASHEARSHEVPLLEARHVTKTYARGGETVHALTDVDVQVGPGTLACIVGRSGSGKSTLLHLLGGLDTPTNGSVLFRGKELSDLDDRELTRYRRQHVGFVFQFFNLLPTLSAWENVSVPMLLGGTPKRDARDRAIDLLAKVGLRNRTMHKATELSGGEMQRVAIARALANEPAVLLGDEPTGNLDRATGDEILALLSSLVASDRAVVLVTHDPNVADAADHVFELEDGQLIAPPTSTVPVPRSSDSE